MPSFRESRSPGICVPRNQWSDRLFRNGYMYKPESFHCTWGNRQFSDFHGAFVRQKKSHLDRSWSPSRSDAAKGSRYVHHCDAGSRLSPSNIELHHRHGKSRPALKRSQYGRILTHFTKHTSRWDDGSAANASPSEKHNFVLVQAPKSREKVRSVAFTMLGCLS